MSSPQLASQVSLNNPIDAFEMHKPYIVKLKLSKVRFRKDNFVIAEFYALDHKMSVSAKCNNMNDVEAGDVIEASVYLTNDPKYGKGFFIEHYHIYLDTNNLYELEEYLKSKIFKGIGAHYASTIVKTFGTDSVNIFENHPHRLAEISGISERMAIDFGLAWQKDKKQRSAKLALLGLGLSENVVGVSILAIARYISLITETIKYEAKQTKTSVESLNQIASLFLPMIDSNLMKKHENCDDMEQYAMFLDEQISSIDYVEIIKINPYLMRGDIKVSTCDEVAIKLKSPLDSIWRIESHLEKISDELSFEYGYTIFPKKIIMEKMVPIFKFLDSFSLWTRISSLNSFVHLHIDGEEYIGLKSVYLKEIFIAESLKSKIKNFQFRVVSTLRSLSNLTEKGNGIVLNAGIDGNDKDQQRAYIESMIERYEKENGVSLDVDQKEGVIRSVSSGVSVVTGGAGVGKTTTAKAILFTLERMGKTITLLAPTGRASRVLSNATGRSSSTIHRAIASSVYSTISRSDVILVDESSMVDVDLMYELLKLTNKRQQIIFLGDVNQLPSIGAGNLLADIIACPEVATTRLTKIFRQAASSKIITASYEINNGVTPEFNNDPSGDCFFFPSATNTTANIKYIYENVLPARNISKERTQILIPMRKGALGTVAINQYMQDFLNPIGSDPLNTVTRDGIRHNDRVIQTSNNYQVEVFNGDIGYIHTPLIGQDQKIEAKSCEVSMLDIGEKYYSATDIKELELSYAMTIHKSQGSEFDCAIIILSDEHERMMYRRLIYTALTRAKKLAIILGSSAALQLAVENNPSEIRFTALRHLLNGNDSLVDNLKTKNKESQLPLHE